VVEHGFTFTFILPHIAVHALVYFIADTHNPNSNPESQMTRCCAIAERHARCALYMGALKIFESP